MGDRLRSPKGTPQICIGKTGRAVRRLLWEREHGPAPEGRTVGVPCEMRSCVNPAHLTLVLFKSTIADRLDEHIDKSGGADACWPWTDAASFHRGYGMFRLGWKRKLMPAHRAVYELVHGVTLRTEDFIMHSCDNPPCCNPAHLTMGTAKLNNEDMWRKGRGSHGEKHGAAVRQAHEHRRVRLAATGTDGPSSPDGSKAE